MQQPLQPELMTLETRNTTLAAATVTATATAVVASVAAAKDRQ